MPILQYGSVTALQQLKSLNKCIPSNIITTTTYMTISFFSMGL